MRIKSVPRHIMPKSVKEDPKLAVQDPKRGKRSTKSAPKVPKVGKVRSKATKKEVSKCVSRRVSKCLVKRTKPVGKGPATIEENNDFFKLCFEFARASFRSIQAVLEGTKENVYSNLGIEDFDSATEDYEEIASIYKSIKRKILSIQDYFSSVEETWKFVREKCKAERTKQIKCVNRRSRKRRMNDENSGNNTVRHEADSFLNFY